jgi:coenzyme F420-reducing hydrogenase gamma subunit
VFKFASCDGCQLSLLDLEDELLELAAAIEIVHFPEASSSLAPAGPFDLVLVEGSISTPEHLGQIEAVRASTKTLITIGACATAGGIQALRNFADHEEFLRIVYAHPKYIESLAQATPISDHVRVDYELRGCPIDRHQLLEVVSALLVGRKPGIPDESVCMECKRRGTVCITVAEGTACMGPVTHAGCGALCPTYGRGCYGCFGPRESPNTVALSRLFSRLGLHDRDRMRLFRNFSGWSPPFKAQSECDE